VGRTKHADVSALFNKEIGEVTWAIKLSFKGLEHKYLTGFEEPR